MILPHKYLDIDNSVFKTGALILQQMQKVEIIPYDELLKKLQELSGENITYSYNLALSFLFLLGKIVYHKEIDSIELLK